MIKPTDTAKATPSGSAQRVAIVTGAGRGIGRAMTLGLAHAGIRVIATAARERAEIEKVAAEAGGDSVLPVIADVTREADAQRLVATALERFGRLDILVNNAGAPVRLLTLRTLEGGAGVGRPSSGLRTCATPE